MKLTPPKSKICGTSSEPSSSRSPLCLSQRRCGLQLTLDLVNNADPALIAGYSLFFKNRAYRGNSQLLLKKKHVIRWAATILSAKYFSAQEATSWLCDSWSDKDSGSSNFAFHFKKLTRTDAALQTRNFSNENRSIDIPKYALSEFVDKQNLPKVCVK